MQKNLSVFHELMIHRLIERVRTDCNQEDPLEAALAKPQILPRDRRAENCAKAAAGSVQVRTPTLEGRRYLDAPSLRTRRGTRRHLR